MALAPCCLAAASGCTSAASTRRHEATNASAAASVFRSSSCAVRWRCSSCTICPRCCTDGGDGWNGVNSRSRTTALYSMPTISLRVKSMDWNFSWIRMLET